MNTLSIESPVKINGPTTLARWSVPRLPERMARDHEWGWHDFNQWCRTFEASAAIAGIRSTAVRCRVEAVVRVAARTMPRRPTGEEMSYWEQSIATAVLRSGLVLPGMLVRPVDVQFRGAAEPDLLDRPRRTGTEITILDARQF